MTEGGSKETGKVKANLLQCNPATLSKTRTTCLPLDSLQRLRDEWNKLYPDHKIATSISNKDQLWSELRLRLQKQYKCETEYCAVESLGTTSADSKFFRPKKPSKWEAKPREWQDSTTISSVMEQYEAAFPDFEFIGPAPIDFDSEEQGIWGRCILDELCRLNLEDLKRNGKRRIGIVFNLDPHDKPGSHWVCAYIDLVRMEAYYYDSYGYQPPKEIKRLLRRCRDQGCKRIIWNDVRHQRKSTECGTYCQYVILAMLHGRSFKQICQSKLDDDTIHSLRDVFFATAKPAERSFAAAATLF